jgi:diaminopimelate epimerase
VKESTRIALVTLRFWKVHGLGNDFVVVEGPPLMAPDRAIRLCDRRRGIGGDGVLTVLPARDGGAAYMHIYNSDGSVAAMCGNGIRCVARHLAETRGLDGEMVIETDSGPRTCTVHRGPGGVDSVTVDMGRARVEGTQEFEVGAELVRALRVSMGNPHAVILDGPGAGRAATLGPAIEARVPGGVNVGFGRAAGSSIDLVVWERGAGLTEACGTGACAAAVAALHEGRLDGTGPVTVRLPGGDLEITVGPDLSVLMKGPAERVFSGETEL